MASTDSFSDSQPERRVSLVGEALAIMGVTLTLGLGGWWWMFSPAKAVDPMPRAKAVSNDYVGNSACGSCHPGETASHKRSGHARTLWTIDRNPVARKLDGVKVEDPELPGVTWNFAVKDGKLTTERDEAGKIEQFLIEYAFGSDSHGTTFVSLVDRDPLRPRALEHRLTHLGQLDALYLTPGQSLVERTVGNTPSGLIHDSEATLRCFQCHVTRTSNRGPKVLDEATMIPNISCERCHGPAQSHVEAARMGLKGEALWMKEGPGRYTAAEQMEQCGECHRTPAMVTSGDIQGDNPVLIRFQPVGLMKSVCYQKSDGQLSCVTCHDPHAKTSRDRPAYVKACLSCHERPDSQKLCTVSPASGCLDCHMPRVEMAGVMTMTDHWIRRKP